MVGWLPSGRAALLAATLAVGLAGVGPSVGAAVVGTPAPAGTHVAAVPAVVIAQPSCGPITLVCGDDNQQSGNGSNSTTGSGQGGPGSSSTSAGQNQGGHGSSLATPDVVQTNPTAAVSTMPQVSDALCGTGEKATGGGFAVSPATPGTNTLHVLGSAPSTGTSGWEVTVLNPASTTQTYHVYAVCVPAS
jgi:hypothetical protein